MKKTLAIAIALLTVTGCNRSRPEAAGVTDAPALITPQVVEVPTGTRIRVRLVQTLDTHRNRARDEFRATLDEPLVVGDRVVVPQGTSFYGHVTQSKPSGRFKGRAIMALNLDAFELKGQRYSIRSRDFARVSAGHKKHHFLWIGGGSGGGAAVGAIAGVGKGALIGAGAGAVAGTVGSAITGKRDVRLAAETPLTFTLRSPVSLRS